MRVIFFCLLFISKISFAEQMTMRGDIWMPFGGDYDNSTNRGYSLDVLYEIFTERNNVEIDYALTSWKRALVGTQNGLSDCVVGASKKEAAGLLLSEHTIGIASNAIIVKKDLPWKFLNIGSLDALRVGVIAGYDYDYPEFDSWVKSHSKNVRGMSTFDSLEPALKMMNLGRLEAFVETPMVFFYEAKLVGVENNFRIEYEFPNKVPMYFACSSKNKERSVKFMRMFDDGLVSLRKTGELAKILKRYSVQDWQ